MRIYLFWCSVVACLSQAAVSPWNVAFNPNTTSHLWGQLKQDYSFDVESGYAEWYFTNGTVEDKAIIWLYLYSDQYYSSFVCITIPLNHPLFQKHYRFQPLARHGQIFYDYYEGLVAVDSFPDEDLSAQVNIKMRNISVKSYQVGVELLLVSENKSTVLHCFILAAFVCVKLGLFVAKLEANDRRQLTENEHGLGYGFTIIVGIGEIYWFFFTISMLYIFPPTITIVVLAIIFIILTGILGLLSLATVTSLPPTDPQKIVKRISIIIVAYVGLATLKALFFGLVAHLSLLHTLLYALSPLFHFIFCLKSNCRPILSLSHWIYLVNVLCISYVMGCPHCLLHHPLYPNFSTLLLGVVVTMILTLTLQSNFHELSRICRKGNTNGSKEEKKLKVLGVCPLCKLPINYQPSNESNQLNRVTYGKAGFDFHTHCLRGLSQQQQQSEPDMVAVEQDS